MKTLEIFIVLVVDHNLQFIDSIEIKSRKPWPRIQIRIGDVKISRANAYNTPQAGACMSMLAVPIKLLLLIFYYYYS